MSVGRGGGGEVRGVMVRAYNQLNDQMNGDRLRMMMMMMSMDHFASRPTPPCPALTFSVPWHYPPTLHPSEARPT